MSTEKADTRPIWGMLDEALGAYPGAKARLAQRLGVTHAGVSHVLKGRTAVSPEFESTAYEVIREMRREQAKRDRKLKAQRQEVLNPPP